MIFDPNPDVPSLDSLAAYTEWLLQGGLAVSTVRNHMSATRTLYLWTDNAIAAEILASSTWSLTIRGLVNTVRPSYSTRAALNPNDLLCLMEEADLYDDLIALNVALSFGYFAYLRISNMAPPKEREFDVSRHTTFADIALRNEGLLFSLKWSKTRQSNKDPVAIPLPSLGSSLLCPFKAWRTYTRPSHGRMLRSPPHRPCSSPRGPQPAK